MTNQRMDGLINPLRESCRCKNTGAISCMYCRSAAEIERLHAALRIAVDELIQYIDFQQKSDYLEYAADSQKKLDSINAMFSGEWPSAVEPSVKCDVCQTMPGGRFCIHCGKDLVGATAKSSAEVPGYHCGLLKADCRDEFCPTHGQDIR